MLRSLLTLCSLLLMHGAAQAHIGDQVYLIHEIPDSDLPNVTDGDLSDWSGLDPNPLTEADFSLEGNEGTGTATEINPADLGYTVQLGWNESTQRMYMAVERQDNVYVNGYPGWDPGNMWQHDAVEFMIDGDHSGGTYNNDKSAQQYLGIAATPDGQHIGLCCFGDIDAWYVNPPYADAGGSVAGGSPHVSTVEMYVSAFDVFDESGPGGSTFSTLEQDKIIGLQISMPDYDAAGQYRSFATLSGQAATWREASRFVDARLIGPAGPPGHSVRVVRNGDYSGVRARTPDQADKGLDTAEEARANKGRGRGKAAVQPNSWARIKAAFQD